MCETQHIPCLASVQKTAAFNALTELWAWAIISWDKWSKQRIVLFVTPFPIKDIAFPPRST